MADMGIGEALLIGGGISGLSSLIGSGMQSSAVSSAAASQERAAEAARQQQLMEWKKTQENLAPYMQQGATATQQLADLQSGKMPIQADPSYQWRLQQGLDALQKSAAARGGFFSGQTGVDLTNYGQGAASQEYQNIFNRLYNQASLGENAAAGAGSLGQGYSQMSGDLAMAQANARGQAAMGQANIWGGALGNISNLATSGMGQYMNYQQQQGLMDYLKGLNSSGAGTGGYGGSAGWNPSWNMGAGSV